MKESVPPPRPSRSAPNDDALFGLSTRGQGHWSVATRDLPPRTDAEEFIHVGTSDAGLVDTVATGVGVVEMDVPRLLILARHQGIDNDSPDGVPTSDPGHLAGLAVAILKQSATCAILTTLPSGGAVFASGGWAWHAEPVAGSPRHGDEILARFLTAADRGDGICECLRYSVDAADVRLVA